MAARSAYGSNPNAGRNPNAQNGWGGYQWPGGVPSALLAVVTGPSGEKVVIRRELAELVGLMFRLAKVKYSRNFLRGWTGGYNNRAIAGTNSPSNHSRGRAFDVDAQDNPMSSTFRSNLDPGMVADWESLGFYWGGRYSGNPDAMHLEFCFAPGDVARFVGRAHALLAPYLSIDPGQPAPPPPPPADPGLGSKGEWPLPPGHYFGPVSGPLESHSGDPKYDNQYTRNYIAEFQNQLNQLGYNAGETDGIWGSKTEAAVLAWQRNNGMPLSSRVALNDWEAIHSDKRVPAGGSGGGSTFPGVTERGARGPVVQIIQDRLVGLGHMTASDRSTGPGIFGPATESAVIRFQRSAGLAPDGVVGPRTWAALGL